MSAGPATTVAWPPKVEQTPEGVRSLVQQVSGLLPRVPWPAARTHEHFCLRSPEQILREGDLNFMTPCAELSSLAAVALKENGLTPTLILTAIKRSLQPMKFQCGLELELEGETWVIGFAIATAYCYAGHFVETKRRPLVLRFPGEAIDPARSFLEWLTPGGLDDMPKLLPGYTLAPHLNPLARQGSSRLRHAWHRRKANDPKRAEGRGRVPGGGGRWS